MLDFPLLYFTFPFQPLLVRLIFIYLENRILLWNVLLPRILLLIEEKRRTKINRVVSVLSNSDLLMKMIRRVENNSLLIINALHKYINLSRRINRRVEQMARANTQRIKVMNRITVGVRLHADAIIARELRAPGSSGRVEDSSRL